MVSQELFRFVGQRPAFPQDVRAVRAADIVRQGVREIPPNESSPEESVRNALAEMRDLGWTPVFRPEHLESDMLRETLGLLNTDITVEDAFTKLSGTWDVKAELHEAPSVRDRFRAAVTVLGRHFDRPDVSDVDPDLATCVLLAGDTLQGIADGAYFAHDVTFSQMIDLGFVHVPPFFVVPDPPRTALARDPSIGDLLLVRQKLTGYHLGEIAAIENVMATESRSHRIRREEITETGMETETLKETVNQSEQSINERSELKSEIEKTLEQQFSIHGDVRVESSLGPTTKLTANVGAEYASSTSETNKSASSFAKETVDKALNKVTERAIERRRNLTRTSTLDDERRGFDNQTAEHVAGIYRWVESDWEATLVNYGERLLLEFIIPEPGAWLSEARDRIHARNIDIEEPHPPMIDVPVAFENTIITRSRPLRPDDLTADNVGAYVQAYMAQGINPPPARTTVISTQLKVGETIKDRPESFAQGAVIDTLVVPDGYEAEEAEVVLLGWPHPDVTGSGKHTVLVSIAGQKADIPPAFPPPNDTAKIAQEGTSTILKFSRRVKLDDSLHITGKMPVAIWSDLGRGLVGTLTVKASRTEHAFQAWQEETFERITAAYAQARQAYEARVAASNAALDGNVAAHTLNLTRSHMLAELKKHIISLLNPAGKPSGQNPLGLPGIGSALTFSDGVSWLKPIPRYERDMIAFLEQAIEWPTLQYVTYPYFWTSATRWADRFNDSFEKDFLGEFLSAGAARVVVAVPQPFYSHVLYYLQTGKPWSGGRPPVITSNDNEPAPDYVSIAQELRQRTDDKDKEKIVDTWAFTMPTNLVMLQKGSDLPDNLP